MNNRQLNILNEMYKITIMDKTPTHALFTQHYISLAC